MKAIWAGVVVIALGTLLEAWLGIAVLRDPHEDAAVSTVVEYATLVAVSLCVALAPALARTARRAALWWLFLGLGAPWWLFMGLLPLAATLPAGLVTGTCCLVGAARSRWWVGR